MRRSLFHRLMPNPKPIQSDAFKQKQYQRTVVENSCIPPDTPLAHKTIGIKLPVGVDQVIRSMGKQKGAWLREVICKAALEQGLVDVIQ